MSYKKGTSFAIAEVATPPKQKNRKPRRPLGRMVGGPNGTIYSHHSSCGLGLTFVPLGPLTMQVMGVTETTVFGGVAAATIVKLAPFM